MATEPECRPGEWILVDADEPGQPPLIGLVMATTTAEGEKAFSIQFEDRWHIETLFTRYVRRCHDVAINQRPSPKFHVGDAVYVQDDTPRRRHVNDYVDALCFHPCTNTWEYVVTGIPTDENLISAASPLLFSKDWPRKPIGAQRKPVAK
jgi:hypothetical protein